MKDFSNKFWQTLQYNTVVDTFLISKSNFWHIVNPRAESYNWKYHMDITHMHKGVVMCYCSELYKKRLQLLKICWKSAENLQG